MRRAGPGRVALEVDGKPWRTVPDEVVARCGLRTGTELERPLLRQVRRALREAQALAAGLRALERHALSEQSLRERLRQRGVPPAAEAEAVSTLAAAGLVDDARFAVRRANGLAERGWGDAAILARLESEGVGEEDARAAVTALDSEVTRARSLVSSLEGRRQAWALLARRGFEAESAAEVLGTLDESA